MNDGVKGRPSLRYQLAGANAQRVGHAQPAPSNGPRVLVVDDDPDMTRLIAATLSTQGIECVAAYDALQGMVVAQKESPALIIVDLHMPAGGGLKLLEKLGASARTASIPVLVVTGDMTSDLPARAAALGARGFLHKPVDLARLVDSIKPHLSSPSA